MSARLHSPFTTIRTEGALLPADLLQRVLGGDHDLGGLTPESYHLSGEKLNEAINRSWNRLQGAWASFREAAARLPEADPATTVTRERWLLPICQELGYGRLLAAKALEIEGKSYPISHGWESVPLHLVGAGTKLDERTPGVAGAARSSPHSLVQELLNRDESRVWGFVSNGLRWRVLRDNASLTRQAFVEFDLEAMFDGEVYADFAVFWLVCHQSRVEAERPETCWLEQWSHAAQERGTRALETLRVGVETAISALGSGFLGHSVNVALRDKLRAGHLDKQDYYRQLLRLVYRLIFLFVAEDRELLLVPGADPATRARYLSYYSATRLRHLAERLRGSRHADLYVALRLVMNRLKQGGSSELGLPELGSFLWSDEAIRDLAGCELANADLLEAVRALAFTVEGRVRRAVDYKNLGPEELGSVYESLLELHPELNADAATFELHSATGNERKTTGSHYTPSSLINCLLDSALDPVIAQALAGKKTPGEAARALLALKVCDPACGSGHFLIGAAYRLAKRLAAIRTGETEPAPEALRTALREVIGHCLYGVDLNPMAVELCKVNLWLESLEPGKPLTFLDHHIQCGNSLIGATPALLARGIPDEAFTPIEGDDKAVCNAFKNQNRQERAGQLSFVLDAERPSWERLGDLAAGMARLETVPDETPEGVRAKQAEYEALVNSTGYEFGRMWADAWCAAFVWKKNHDFAYPITENIFRDIERNPFNVAPWMRDEISRLAAQYRFFHWQLAFPDVFRSKLGAESADDAGELDVRGWLGGFDCVLGNPPWDVVKAERNQSFQDFARLKHFLGQAIYTVLSGKKDLYKLFVILTVNLVAEKGRVSLLTPLGMFVEEEGLSVRQLLFERGSLVSLEHFQNRGKRFFPDVDSRYRFVAMCYSPNRDFGTKYSTVIVDPAGIGGESWYQVGRQELPEHFGKDLAAIFFPNNQYAEIYQRINQRLRLSEPQEFSVIAEFHATSDKKLFSTSSNTNDWKVLKNRCIHHYDYQFSPVEDYVSPDVVADRCRVKGLDPDYWTSGPVERLVFRDIARGDDARTLICALAPHGYVSSYDTPMLVPQGAKPDEIPEVLAYLIGILNSFVYDFIVRPRVDKHVKAYVIHRLPIPRYCDSQLQRQVVVAVRDLMVALRRDPTLEEIARLRAQIESSVAELAHMDAGDLNNVLESFPIVREADVAKYGSYRTRDFVLQYFSGQTME